MAKYLYMVRVKWTSKATSGGQEWFKKWMSAHDKVCKDEGVKCLWSGFSYGTVEDSAFFYETDLPLVDFHKFKNDKIFTLLGGGYLDYGNTSSFLSWPWTW